MQSFLPTAVQRLWWPGRPGSSALPPAKLGLKQTLSWWCASPGGTKTNKPALCWRASSWKHRAQGPPEDLPLLTPRLPTQLGLAVS